MRSQPFSSLKRPGSKSLHIHVNEVKGKRNQQHPVQLLENWRKKELFLVGFEPTTQCSLRECSTNWAGNSVARGSKSTVQYNTNGYLKPLCYDAEYSQRMHVHHLSHILLLHGNKVHHAPTAICGASGQYMHSTLHYRELYYQSQAFSYFQCAKCSSIQIKKMEKKYRNPMNTPISNCR